jgi:diguanylate cyclase (GGDEF)-like protein/PAS domain S-box-containing protein
MARLLGRIVRHGSSGLSPLEAHHPERRLAGIVVLYLVLIAGIVGYNAREMAHERGAALIVNVAARQRALAERYVKDAILDAEGVQADPGDDATQLLANADALQLGGDVIAVQGADSTVHIPPASDDPRVIAKLDAERRLIEKMIASGEALLQMSPADPRFATQLLDLRVAGAQVASISNDAVGQMTADTEAGFARLVVVGITLGVFGAIAAIAMGLLLRRAGAQRSAQFRSLVHNASDLITVVGVQGGVRYQSPSASKLVGVASETLLGTNYLDIVDPDDRPHLDVVLAGLVGSPGGSTTAEYRVSHTDGSSRFVESIVSNLLDDPSVKGLVLNTRDVTERKNLEEELAHQAFHDSLTGLSNRAVFRDRLDHALSRSLRHEQSLAVLLLDLDSFKTVNDSLGHDVGDELLVAVGARIGRCARSSDTVARLGGDEFVVLLEEDVDETRSRSVATRMLNVLAAPFDVSDREVFIGASVGIAVSDGGSVDADELIRNADTAMYAAKAAGRGRYEIFQPAMHVRALERFEVQADLRRALDRTEFRLQYQPIVDFATGAIQGVEALIRWMHPSRGLLPPGDFIEAAEETGLIVPMGMWVLDEACRQTAAWRDEHPQASGLWVSVNLSTRQLLEPDLVARVREVLERSGLDPSALVLEITEGSLLQGVGETVEKLRDLKALGIRLAIDDFGTGSSSLGHLRRFPIDVLKIDKSFVDEVATSGSEGPALVRAIVDLAKTLQLETVAEGIEEIEQLTELRSAGCLSGQGFLFARPLQPDAIGPLLQRGAPASPPWRDTDDFLADPAIHRATAREG